ncbi:MAG: response regulator, partial [Chloroflexota bacterium]
MTKPLALIIEDELELADIFTVAVQTAEFETETIRNGSAARIRLQEVIPALVILDLHLPGASGKDILQQIRADERLSQTR